MSALSALLFHWGVLQRVVRGISWLLERAMGVGGVVGLSTAANVFVGMVEAPLFVRPWLARVSRGELFAIMVGGMASIAGTVLFLYASILGKVIPDAVAHLLIASIVSAPAALVVAFLMVPPDGRGDRRPSGPQVRSLEQHGCADAAARWTARSCSSTSSPCWWCSSRWSRWSTCWLHRAATTLQGLLGWALAPLAWLAGMPWSEAQAAGSAARHQDRAERTGRLHRSRAGMTALSERSRLLMTYALCGFANFGSLGIMIGGMSTMCPERRAGDRLARHEIHRRRHARDLPYRGDRGLDRLGFSNSSLCGALKVDGMNVRLKSTPSRWAVA